jgi:disulfide bond formation protein DsbB
MKSASLPAERILLALGVGSLALILGALGFQYLAHLKPCEMCHWQRWPHIAAAFLGIGGTFLARGQARNLAWIAAILIAISGLIGLYQTGMQVGILPGPQACSVAHPYVMGSNVEPEVQCNAVTWSLFGLSLAAYNALFSFLLAGAAAFVLGTRK